MIPQGQIKIECSKCHKKIIIPGITFDDFNAVECENREMGTETEYDCTNISNCPNCLNEISITLGYWEYPEGVFNYAGKVNIEGATVIKDGLSS